MTTDLEIRSVQLRAETNTEAREIRGIAVPWNELATIDGEYMEQFVRGSIEPHPAGIKLYDQHRTLVGVVVGEDTDLGYEIVGTVAASRAGDDFLALARSGALGHLSIGFLPRQQTVEEQPDGLPVVTRTSALLAETSGVPFPAYAGASITDVREARSQTNQKENVVTQTATEDTTADLREAVTDLERQVVAMRDNTAERFVAASQFRSAGDFLKALARGDEAARTELRDFGTTVEADAASRPAWLSRPLKLKDEKRRVMNLFSSAPLPAEGMSVEYPFVLSTTGTVGEQALEGDLLGYMEVALDTGTSPVKTYGGYSSMSRQAIERSDLAYLDAVLRFQALQYVKQTEIVTKAFLNAATGTNTATLAGDTVEGWIDLVIDGTAAVEDNSLGLVAEFMLVSRDVFKKIAHKTDASDRPVFAINGDGSNTVGSANIVKASANIGGLGVVVDPTLAANTCWIASSEAITSLESPGAPFRLADESIVNLTKDFSLYGYLAHTLNDAKGLTKCDVDLV